MKKLLLLLAICFLSCSEDKPESKCYQITDKKLSDGSYYLDLNNYGLKKVSQTEFNQYRISQEYCLGLKY